MKTYIFKRGRVEVENLSGSEIKTHEYNMGELCGVITNKGFVPVVDKDGNSQIMYNGECHTFKEWSEITGICSDTLKSRYYGAGDRGERLFRPLEENKSHRSKQDDQGRIKRAI